MKTVIARRNGKKVEFDRMAFQNITELADENPGKTQRFAVAAVGETKYYDITRVTP